MLSHVGSLIGRGSGIGGGLPGGIDRGDLEIIRGFGVQVRLSVMYVMYVMFDCLGWMAVCLCPV